MRYMIANLILALLPPTRFFGLKRTLLRALGIAIGDETRVCGGVRFFGAGRIVIGRDCWIGLNTCFYTSSDGHVEIGDRCDIAPDVVFMNGSHRMGNTNRRAGEGTAGTIRVAAGCWIGVRSVLLGNATIGFGTMVGAGSLVLGRQWPDNALLLGVPAAVVKTLSDA